MISDLEKKLLDFFVSTKTNKVFLGLSGGIDSALTLAIAVNSLGKNKVVPILMPYKLGQISSHENFNDATDLCKTFNLSYLVKEIDEFVLPYENFFTDLAFANTLARIRMTILFGYANQEKGIVLGTCNKTEILLGYETKFGDGASDVSVIGSLWKSEVYDLAKKYNLPKNFLIKKPSAELFKSQTDESEMGFSYNDADKVLKRIENNNNLQLLDFKGIEKKIFLMYKGSMHKRILSPVL